jgi:hypothetical protein
LRVFRPIKDQKKHHKKPKKAPKAPEQRISDQIKNVPNTHKPKIPGKSTVNEPDTDQVTKQKRSDIVQQLTNIKCKEPKFIIQPTKKDIEDRKIERERKHQQQIEKEQKQIAAKPANTRVLPRKYLPNLKKFEYQQTMSIQLYIAPNTIKVQVWSCLLKGIINLVNLSVGMMVF